MFRKHPLPPHPAPTIPSATCRFLLAVALIPLLSTTTHAVLYASPSATPPLSHPYTTATSLFSHVIRHDVPATASALRLAGPPPTVASPPPLPPPPQHTVYSQPQHHPGIGSNLRYLTRSSPAHRSHLAAIYAPAPNQRPAVLSSPPPPPHRHFHSAIQYQPGNGAYRVGPSYGPPVAFNPSAQRHPFALFDLPPLTGHLAGIADLSYIVEGRLLKQYLVMEDHDDDNTLHEFYNDPVNRNAYVPYLPHLNFGQRGADRPNLGFPAGLRGSPARFQQQPPSVAQFAQLQQQQQQQRQPAYALGSGSLGFVRHPSGAIYLGSGSLGYINDQQQTDHVQNLRNRQTPGPGPLSFGHTPQ